MTVARRDVGAGLGDADDGAAGLQLVETEAEVHGALQVERGHVGVVGVVEPGLRAQARDGLAPRRFAFDGILFLHCRAFRVCAAVGSARQSAMYCSMISAKFSCGFRPSRAARAALAPPGQLATMPAMRSSRS